MCSAPHSIRELQKAALKNPLYVISAIPSAHAVICNLQKMQCVQDNAVQACRLAHLSRPHGRGTAWRVCGIQRGAARMVHRLYWRPCQWLHPGHQAGRRVHSKTLAASREISLDASSTGAARSLADTEQTQRKRSLPLSRHAGKQLCLSRKRPSFHCMSCRHMLLTVKAIWYCSCCQHQAFVPDVAA